MIGEKDILIPEHQREEWDTELKGYTKDKPMDYKIIIWPGDVHGFSIEYSDTLYNTFQSFGLNLRLF